MSGGVLGVFPHPDDEAYAAGGALARAAREGVCVDILCATRGGQGQNYREGDTRSLPQIRAEELACSCAALGARPPRFLDLEDGCLDRVDFPGVVAGIVRVIRELRPRVVVTLGADGVYGHPDHVALHRLVVAAVPSAAGGDRFPAESLGPPHRVERLAFCAFPPGLFRPQYEQMLTTELAGAVRMVDPNRLGTPPSGIAVVLSLGDLSHVKLRSLGCHRSQYPGSDPRAIFPAGIVDAVLPVEMYSLAGPPPAQRLTHLLDGLADG